MLRYGLSGFSEWENLSRLVKVEVTREIKDQKMTKHRHYLADFALNAEISAQTVTNFWGIENKLHWSLDMTFREDDSRARVGLASENLVLV